MALTLTRWGGLIGSHLDQVGCVVARQLEVGQRVPAGDPGVLQDLLRCVALVGVHMEHVGEQVLRQTDRQTDRQ